MVPSIKHPIPRDIDFKAWLISMPIVTLDFETFYSDEYSLSNMTLLEYVQDERFKAQSVSIRIDQVVKGELQRGVPNYFANVEAAMAILRNMDQIGPWALNGQNTKFDGYILHYHYGIHPTVYCDTKSMSKGVWPFERANLESLAKRLWPNDPTMRKGQDLVQSKGIRDWSDELHETIKVYCNQDTFLTAEAFWTMFNRYPSFELEVIHITTRMTCMPVLQANHEILKEAEQDELDERARVIDDALAMANELVALKGLEYWNPDAKEAKKKKPLDSMLFSSRNRFIKLLTEICDLELPMKTKQRKDGSEYQTEATAKNDPEYLDLVADNPDLALLFEAREIFASNQAISRARRMRHVAKPDRNCEMPIPLGYYNAHTGRYGGEEKLNMQNLGRGSKHRLALEAPDGFMVHVADSSNVEARINAGFAEQHDLVEAFRQKSDVYSMFASEVYGFKVDKKNNPGERGVGKVCVSGDTLILTNNGVKPILYLSRDDKLWDGIEWVTHLGIACNGEKETLTAFGLEATPDHEILTQDDLWVEWQQVHISPYLMKRALNKARLPSPDGKISSEMASLSVGTLSLNAIAAGKEWLTALTSQVDEQSAAIIAQKWLRVESDMKNTCPSWKTTTTAPDCSTDCRQQYQDVTTSKTGCMSITGSEESTFIPNGETTEHSSCDMFKISKGGITPTLKWIEQTLIEVMNRETSDSSPEKLTQEINEKSLTSNNGLENSKRQSLVYDVVNAGPRNRFTVITELGPIIVHNCVLGLGYGMGAPTLRRTFAAGPMGMPPIKFELEFCQKIVHTYRSINDAITGSWKTAGRMIEAMITLRDGDELDWGPLKVMKEKIQLPNGMYLNYPKLAWNERLKSFAYWQGMYWKRIYGGALIENIIQALARIAVMTQCVEIDRYMQQYGGLIVMQVHDENIGVLPDFGEEKNNEHFAQINQLMCVSPTWMPDLPLDSEGGWAKNYSK